MKKRTKIIKKKRMLHKLFRREKQKEANVDFIDLKSPTAPPSALEDLPVEVKREYIASFLSVRDLLNLSETSKRIHKDLEIVVLSSPLTDRQSQNKTFQTEGTLQCFGAILPHQGEEELAHSHRTIFAFHVVANPFSDGTVWVVEQNLPTNQSPEMLQSIRFGRGKSVARVNINSSGKVNLSFLPKTGKFYQLWVNAQAFDGDSRICLNNMMLHQVGFATRASRHVAFQFETPLRRRMRISAVK